MNNAGLLIAKYERDLLHAIEEKEVLRARIAELKAQLKAETPAVLLAAAYHREQLATEPGHTIAEWNTANMILQVCYQDYKRAIAAPEGQG